MIYVNWISILTRLPWFLILNSYFRSLCFLFKNLLSLQEDFSWLNYVWCCLKINASCECYSCIVNGHILSCSRKQAVPFKHTFEDHLTVWIDEKAFSICYLWAVQFLLWEAMMRAFIFLNEINFWNRKDERKRKLLIDMCFCYHMSSCRCGSDVDWKIKTTEKKGLNQCGHIRYAHVFSCG